MIIFWIFTLFAGASTFAFTSIFLQLGLAWSLADAFVAILLCRGLLSVVRRSLILRERISAETDTLTRTVETNSRRFQPDYTHRAGGRAAADPDLPMVPDQRAPIVAVSESA